MPSTTAGYVHYRRDLDAALAEGRRGEAVAMFMALAGSPPGPIAQARKSEFWPGLERLAHTLAYDAQLYGRPPVDLLATIEQPTLVATGSGAWFYEAAADAVAEAIPGAERVRLAKQGHVVDPAALAPILGRFLRGE